MFIHARSFLTTMLTAAILAQAFIPVGFMPQHRTDAQGHALYALVICSSMGTKTVYLPKEQLPVAPDDATDHDNSKPAPASHMNTAGSTAGGNAPCHFAAAGSAHLAAAPGTAAPSVFVYRTDYDADHLQPAHALIAHMYLSQGPPLTI